MNNKSAESALFEQAVYASSQQDLLPNNGDGNSVCNNNNPISVTTNAETGGKSSNFQRHVWTNDQLNHLYGAALLWMKEEFESSKQVSNMTTVASSLIKTLSKHTMEGICLDNPKQVYYKLTTGLNKLKNKFLSEHSNKSDCNGYIEQWEQTGLDIIKLQIEVADAKTQLSEEDKKMKELMKKMELTHGMGDPNDPEGKKLVAAYKEKSKQKKSEKRARDSFSSPLASSSKSNNSPNGDEDEDEILSFIRESKIAAEKERAEAEERRKLKKQSLDENTKLLKTLVSSTVENGKALVDISTALKNQGDATNAQTQALMLLIQKQNN